MPDSEWVKSIKTILDDSLGSNAQKQDVIDTARKIEEILPTGTGNAEKFGNLVRSGYTSWVSHMRYLVNHEARDHHLPDSMLRSDAEIASEYGLTSAKGIEAKQEQIAKNRETRIARAIWHMEHGEDAFQFCAAKDEWREVQRRARREAA